MKVLVIGGGGREHAIAWKLSQSKKLTKLFCAPGNAGTAEIAENVPGLASTKEMASWAKDQKIDLTVVGPEAPLAAGIVDEFREQGLRIFGPSKAAAQLEASKSFAKEIMLASDVKTAEGQVFSDFEAASSYVKEKGAPIVIKADGLAAGKGVVVAQTLDDALQALQRMMLDKQFGDSGVKVVVEKCLDGLESSVMAVIDGKTIKPLVISRDFKRLLNGDEGPNTGGMGAVSPSNVLADSEANRVVKEVFEPVVAELANRGVEFTGFLYAGMMISSDGETNVLEFNCRLGDPETQVIMARLESDLLEVLDAAVDARLDEVEMEWSKSAAACVVASSKGYPEKVEDGKVLKGLFADREKQIVFQAGTTQVDREILTKGGRILVVTGIAPDVSSALDQAYKGIKEIDFEGMHYRTDIGKLD